ncbi:unnamed protein product [Rangifer tarandus platyrhynchus]|uniref:Uncharacterized protein n=2 Tax=Rangifer tarandus platyrhynchus TaxID=3082113 RepID=A0ACB0EH33_RANTA|nr:unnamed protein product [Rangifer tarandus platyrhynchus]CAI9699853.1 unnamed protein product [Rangifer tarandus platyrhynchus]
MLLSPLGPRCSSARRRHTPGLTPVAPDRLHKALPSSVLLSPGPNAPIYKDSAHAGLGPTPQTSIYLDHLCQDPLSIRLNKLKFLERK